MKLYAIILIILVLGYVLAALVEYLNARTKQIKQDIEFDQFYFPHKLETQKLENDLMLRGRAHADKTGQPVEVGKVAPRSDNA